MFKSELRGIVRRVLILVVLVAGLGAAAETNRAGVAYAACPSWQEWDCYNSGGVYFNPFHCTCSYQQDIDACEQAGGTWDYHMARCRF